jgi:hypothetical protein
MKKSSQIPSQSCAAGQIIPPASSRRRRARRTTGIEIAGNLGISGLTLQKMVNEWIASVLVSCYISELNQANHSTLPCENADGGMPATLRNEAHDDEVA